jgi:hypothetical protein
VESILAKRQRALVVSGEPSFARPDSQLVTASQIYEPEFAQWASFFSGCTLDRKTWEYCYILQAISVYASERNPGRGLCFGAGREVLPALLASREHNIVATDWRIGTGQGWQTQSREDLFHPHVISRELFDRNVELREVDMNNIPDDLREFDFLWSCGALEHIGSHANGLRFIEEAMACLKPGGIAVHTTEFTITSATVHYDHPEMSFYCMADILELASRLTEAGHLIVLNFTRGSTVADTHVDIPPYHSGMTLAAHHKYHVITSIGLIIQRGC